jgi:hypothetical protein
MYLEEIVQNRIFKFGLFGSELATKSPYLKIQAFTKDSTLDNLFIMLKNYIIKLVFIIFGWL